MTSSAGKASCLRPQPSAARGEGGEGIRDSIGEYRVPKEGNQPVYVESELRVVTSNINGKFCGSHWFK